MLASHTGARAVPWPDVAIARFFLGGVATGEWDDCDDVWLERLDQKQIGRWLARQGLAPLAHRRCREAFPGLAAQLADAFYSTAAMNVRRFHELSQVLDRFRVVGIPVVLLKGAALAEKIYGGLSLRPMGDIDLWLRDADMQEAVGIMQELGFRMRTKKSRPLALQFLSRGEVQLHRQGLIELHWSPFKGWWLRRTALVSDGEIWERAKPLVTEDQVSVARDGQMGFVRQMMPEDLVIHVAVHTAVSHKFGMVAVRALMDVVLTAQVCSVDWRAVAERARRWRVATVVWTVLDLAERLIGLPDATAALAGLCPSPVRRVLLRRFVSPESMLVGRDMRGSRARYLFQLLLVDRPRDALHLVLRALWPEREWLAARYGKGWNRWNHLWNVLRHGEV